MSNLQLAFLVLFALPGCATSDGLDTAPASLDSFASGKEAGSCAGGTFLYSGSGTTQVGCLFTGSPPSGSCGTWSTISSSSNGTRSVCADAATLALVTAGSWDSLGQGSSAYQYPADLTSVGCSTVPVTPRAWWRFDEGPADALVDAKGAVADGVVYGGAALVDGDVLRARRFDGVDDYVLIGDDSDLDFAASQDFSIAFRYRADSTAATGNKGILGKVASGGVGWSVLTASGRLALQFRNGAGVTTLLSTAAFPMDGAWHDALITVDRDSSTGAMFYADAAVVGSPRNPSGWATTNLSNAEPLTVGKASAATSGVWTGDLDELMIFPSALSATQATQLAAGGVYGNCP